MSKEEVFPPAQKAQVPTRFADYVNLANRLTQQFARGEITARDFKAAIDAVQATSSMFLNLQRLKALGLDNPAEEVETPSTGKRIRVKPTRTARIRVRETAEGDETTVEVSGDVGDAADIRKLRADVEQQLRSLPPVDGPREVVPMDPGEEPLE